MDRSEKSQISKYNELNDFIHLYKNLSVKLKTLTDSKASLRLKIIDKMKLDKIKSAFITTEEGKKITAGVSFPTTFDIGMCKLENPEVMRKFITVERQIIENEIFDKKAFIQYQPELYKKYLIEGTPRLTVK